MRLPKLQKGTLLCIHWRDHTGYDGWKDPDKEVTTLTCESLGAVHSQKEKEIAICMTTSWTEDNKPREYSELNQVAEILVVLTDQITDWWIVK